MTMHTYVKEGCTGCEVSRSTFPSGMNSFMLLFDSHCRLNETLCMYSYNVTFDYETENKTVNGSICQWWWDGSGLLYQIVAGPVFNNLYILAGVFTGFLADYGSRKIWLVISLVFWSIVTGVTGFVHQYWHIVILRALLAIGSVLGALCPLSPYTVVMCRSSLAGPICSMKRGYVCAWLQRSKPMLCKPSLNGSCNQPRDENCKHLWHLFASAATAMSSS